MRIRTWLGVGGAVVAVAAAGAFGATGGGTITTIAGNGKAGFAGDGGPATRAQLSIPSGVAVDAKGNVYIADTSNNRVRKVSPGGTITTFAGTNTGSSEDGGLATSARLIQPVGLAVDRQGNVYIGEYGGSRVRKVSAAGTITTLAGTGARGSSGDGGPATSAQLYFPRGLAVDRQGNVYITDWELSTVRKVSPAGTITTIAGTGRPGFSGDGGPATRAQLHGPEAVTVDGKGNVYIADTGNGRVRKVSSAGRITTIAGGGASLGDGGPATSASLSNPHGLAVDGTGNVYVADWGHYRVRKVSGGRITTFAGTGGPGCGAFAIGASIGDGRAATSAFLCQPDGLALDAKGNLYVTENGRSRVRRIGKAPAAVAPASSTRSLRTFGGGIEAYLRESARGRAKLRTALGGVLNCSMPLGTAAAQVAAVTANRRGLLARLGTLNAPTAQAKRIASLLRQALSHSIAADVRYEAWIRFLQGQPACSTARNADLVAAQREDRLATAAKQSFVAAYNPFARRLGLRTWSADEF